MLLLGLGGCRTAVGTAPPVEIQTGYLLYDAALAIAGADSLVAVAETAATVSRALNPDPEAGVAVPLGLPLLRYVMQADPQIVHPQAWATAIDVAFTEMVTEGDRLGPVWQASSVLVESLTAAPIAPRGAGNTRTDVRALDGQRADALVRLIAGLLSAPDDDTELLMQAIDSVLVIQSPALRAETLVRVITAYTERRDLGRLNALVQQTLAALPQIADLPHRLAVMAELAPLSARLNVESDLRPHLRRALENLGRTGFEITAADLPRIRDTVIRVAQFGLVAEAESLVQRLRPIEAQALLWAVLAREAHRVERPAAAAEYLVRSWNLAASLDDPTVRLPVQAEIIAVVGGLSLPPLLFEQMRLLQSELTPPVVAALESPERVVGALAFLLSAAGLPLEANTVAARLTGVSRAAAFLHSFENARTAGRPAVAISQLRLADRVVDTLILSGSRAADLAPIAYGLASGLIAMGEVERGLRLIGAVAEPRLAAQVLAAVPPVYQPTARDLAAVQAYRARVRR